MSVLSSAQRNEEYLSKHSKLWEEAMYPFKLLADCEKKFYESERERAPPQQAQKSAQAGFLADSFVSLFVRSFVVSWTFLQLHPPEGEQSSGDNALDRRKANSGSASSRGDNEETMRFMYNQIPTALKKTMQTLQKFIMAGGGGPAQGQGGGQQPAMHHSSSSSGFGGGGGGGRLPHSASSAHLLSAQPSSPTGTSGGGLGGSESVFASTLLLLEELVGIFIPLRICLIQFYQSLSFLCAPGGGISGGSGGGSGSSGGSGGGGGGGAPRLKEVMYDDVSRMLEKLRRRMERAFTHPHLVRLNQALILPELCLLEQCINVECEDPKRGGSLLPAFDWTSTMFALMRIKAEHARWMNRILARDNSINANNNSSSSSSNSRKAVTNKSISTLHVSVSTCVFPSVLHWVHQLHHSLLCKATFVFWGMTVSKSVEIKGYGEEMALRLANLEAHYVALCDRIVKKVPHAYSCMLLMDASSSSSMGGRPVVDPLRPLVLRDSAVSEEDALAAEEAAGVAAAPSTGGLGQYPVLFSWPAHRAAVLEKWNLVSLLQQKQDLMSDLSSAFHANPSKAASFVTRQQTATYILATGPSNHPGDDLLVWDYENEVARASPTTGIVAPGSVSYFLCKIDTNKNVYFVITFQAGCNEPPAAAVPNNAATTTPNNHHHPSSSGPSGASNPPTPPTHLTRDYSGANWDTNDNAFSTSAAASAAAASTSAAAAAASSPPSSCQLLLSASARKRAFDHVLSEVTPMLFKLRHMHVFQNLQPGVYKKKS